MHVHVVTLYFVKFKIDLYNLFNLHVHICRTSTTERAGCNSWCCCKCDRFHFCQHATNKSVAVVYNFTKFIKFQISIVKKKMV